MGVSSRDKGYNDGLLIKCENVSVDKDNLL